jgi:response regulator RpfG family c-di-GMP phosphodiesterase
MTAEKEVLGTTLRRTVEALTAILSLAQPAAFGRAIRVTRTVTELAEALEIEDAWELEVTAMLSHLGAVTLPPAVLTKLDAGRPLNEEEAEMVGRVPGISRDLVRTIPRLEGVAEAIGWHLARYDGAGSGIGVPRGENLPLAARVLRLAADFDAGMSQRPSVQATVSALRADAGAYDPRVLAALVTAHDVADTQASPRDVDVDDLAPGMVVFDDVYTTEGVLLISRGTEVTDALILRIENYARQKRVARRVRVHG